jgi:osmotically inducible protein OsmC
MATAVRRARATWRGDLQRGEGQFDVGSGAISTQQVTWAHRSGEPEGHTSPEELIAAAQATCYAMALSNTLAQDGNPPGQLDVTAACTLEIGTGITTMDIEVEGRVPGLDQSGFEDAARRGEQACPVANALRGNVDIRLTATLAQ